MFWDKRGAEFCTHLLVEPWVKYESCIASLVPRSLLAAAFQGDLAVKYGCGTTRALIVWVRVTQKLEEQKTLERDINCFLDQCCFDFFGFAKNNTWSWSISILLGLSQANGVFVALKGRSQGSKRKFQQFFIHCQKLDLFYHFDFIFI